jgi:hypothetical protein
MDGLLKNFGVIDQERLNEVTGSCCMIPTRQLSSSSYLEKNRFTVLHHPHYAPDLALADYFLFFKVKSNHKVTVLTPFQTSRTCDE